MSVGSGESNSTCSLSNIHVVAPVLCPAHNVWCGHVYWCGADSPIIIILSSALMRAAHNLHDFCSFPLPSQVLLPYVNYSKQANSFKDADIDRAIIGLARTIYIRFIYTMFLAGKTPNIRSYTVYIYGSGQPYTCVQYEEDCRNMPMHLHTHAHTHARAHTHKHTHLPGLLSCPFTGAQCVEDAGLRLGPGNARHWQNQHHCAGHCCAAKSGAHGAVDRLHTQVLAHGWCVCVCVCVCARARSIVRLY